MNRTAATTCRVYDRTAATATARPFPSLTSWALEMHAVQLAGHPRPLKRPHPLPLPPHPPSLPFAPPLWTAAGCAGSRHTPSLFLDSYVSERWARGTASLIASRLRAAGRSGCTDARDQGTDRQAKNTLSGHMTQHSHRIVCGVRSCSKVTPFELTWWKMAFGLARDMQFTRTSTMWDPWREKASARQPFSQVLRDYEQI